MKAHIISNYKITDHELFEIEAVLGFRPTVEITKKKIRTKLNPYFNQIWGDFNWLRSLFNKQYDIRCFVTTKDELKRAGIQGHIGMYDVADGDQIHDFYFGVPSKLDKRAKANGFTTNVAWLFVHEYLHGLEKFNGSPDRVHAMEEQGRLLELWEEHKKKLTIDLQKKAVELLQKLLSSFTSKKDLLSLVKRKANAVVKEMELLGHPVRIVEGYRSMERQAELYAQGRTKPGNIVTNAKPGESFHNYGVAVDFVFRKEGYNASDTLWKTLGTIGKKHGFKWGGDWSKFKDKPHLEMPLSYTIKDFQSGNVDYSKYK